jgi:Ca-activated chloride channel family protein
MTPRVSIALALLMLTGTTPGAAQQPAFSTKVESVRVDVLVTDKGQPLLGLGPADFEVLDNGVAQQVDLVSFEQIPLNVILALDMSDSVAGDRLDHLRGAGAALLAGLKKDDQAALVTFSHVVQLGAKLTTDVEPVRAALNHAQGAGETALVDGAYAGIMLGESDVGRALLIVFSDGLDTSSWLTAEAVLETAKRSDVVVYSVSAGGAGNAPFLRELSALTGGTLFKIESTKDLSAAFVRILEEFRHRYLVSYTPRGVAKNGWHQLEVRVRNRKATIKARAGYLAGD